MKLQPPLRILHLTAGSDAGGVTRYLFDLCRAMHEAGHRVTIAGERGAWHDLFRDAPWTWIDVPLKGGPFSLALAARKLRQYLKQNPVDVIHSHYRKASMVGRRIQSVAAAPLLYTLHLSHMPLNGAWGWLTDFGDQVHAASTEARQWLVEQAHVAPDRISLIPHGIDPQKFPVVTTATRKAARDRLRLDENACIALYVGRLEDPKNEGWLLDLAATTRQSLPNLQLLMAGDGPNESLLRQRIDLEHLSERVRLLGRADPLPLYHAADALLLPSQREGFSLACAEAMCAGLPVLRTRTSGTAELIVEGVTGKSVQIDRQTFVAAATEFLGDRANLPRMGLAAAEHIRQHFTFDRQLVSTVALYRRLACGIGPNVLETASTS